jgi:hypothetical protein
MSDLFPDDRDCREPAREESGKPKTLYSPANKKPLTLDDYNREIDKFKKAWKNFSDNEGRNDG